MGRLLAIAALLVGGYLVLNDGRGVQLQGGSAGGGGFGSYTGASGSAIKGIAGAAGG